MDQNDLLRHVVGVLDQQQIIYAVVGSIASAAYGEPRMTRDIDIIIRLARPQVAALCRAFPDDQYYVSTAAADEAVAQDGQFNVIHTTSGNKIDFMIARTDAWGKNQLQRRVRKNIFPDLEVCFAAPEDVILGKLWYFQEGGSDKHLRDIAAMLEVSDTEIDRHYIDHWAAQLGLTESWLLAQNRGE